MVALGCIDKARKGGIKSVRYGATPARQTINELLRERRALSPSMALRLSRLFGNSPEFWLNAQRAVDLWQARNELDGTLNRIRTLHAA